MDTCEWARHALATQGSDETDYTVRGGHHAWPLLSHRESLELNTKDQRWKLDFVVPISGRVGHSRKGLSVQLLRHLLEVWLQAELSNVDALNLAPGCVVSEALQWGRGGNHRQRSILGIRRQTACCPSCVHTCSPPERNFIECNGVSEQRTQRQTLAEPAHSCSCP